MKDHIKTIGIIIGVIAALALIVFLMVTFEKQILIGMFGCGVVYFVYTIYTGVLKEVRLTRKRKEVANARKSEG